MAKPIPYTKPGPRGAVVQVGWRVPWVDHTGKRRWKRLQNVDLRTALEWQRQQQARSLLEQSGARLPAERTTLAEWSARYFAASQVKASTHRNQAGIYERHLAPHLGSVPLAGLTPAVVSTWLRHLTMAPPERAKKTGRPRREPASPSLKARAEKVLTAMVRKAAWEGLFGDRYQGAKVSAFQKPWHGVSVPKVEASARPGLSTPEEYRRLLSAAFEVGGDRLVVGCLFAMLCGHRRGELPHLRWNDDVVFRRQDGAPILDAAHVHEAVSVRVHVRASFAKSKRDRASTVADRGAVVVLARWRQQHPEATHVFTATRPHYVRGVLVAEAGRPLSEVVSYEQWVRVREVGQLHPAFRFHDLRGSYAKSLLRSGLDLQQVQKLMGHASMETTRRYLLELREVDEHAAAAAFSGWVDHEAVLPEPAPLREVAAKKRAAGAQLELAPRPVDARPAGAGRRKGPAPKDTATGDTYGDALRAARVAAGLSQRALAELVHPHVPSLGSVASLQPRLSQIESGKWRPEPADARALGRALAEVLGTDRLRFVPVRGVGQAARGTA